MHNVPGTCRRPAGKDLSAASVDAKTFVSTNPLLSRRKGPAALCCRVFSGGGERAGKFRPRAARAACPSPATRLWRPCLPQVCTAGQGRSLLRPSPYRGLRTEGKTKRLCFHRNAGNGRSAQGGHGEGRAVSLFLPAEAFPRRDEARLTYIGEASGVWRGPPVSSSFIPS